MKQPKAFIFDLNGTMIDDMEYHSKAWYHILNNELHAGLSREEVKSQMYGKNSELLIRVFGTDRFTQEQMDELSMEKEKRYQQAFLPHLMLIPGLADFLDKAGKQQIQMAIGSAAIPFNIDFVIDNLNIRQYFKVLISADDVHTSKPDPETFLKAASALNIAPDLCIVFEDNPKGVESALNAGMPCVVIETMHRQQDFDMYPNVLAFIKDYTDQFCRKLVNGQWAISNGQS